jgi:hypothetical protein
MMPLIAPVAPDSIRAELAALTPLRAFRGIEVHSFIAADCPLAMREIGRIREKVFRSVGAGRGGGFDVDDLDFGPHPYRQLVAWDPGAGEIVAAYRYQLGRAALEGGDAFLRTASLFDYGPAFRAQWLPHGIELGRSVVNKDARRHTAGLYALWLGLGALPAHHGDIRCYFGNVCLYGTMDPAARDRLVAWLEHHCPPPEPYLVAKAGLRHVASEEALEAARAVPCPQEPGARIETLRQILAPYGAGIPPILQSYLGLTRDVWCGETALDTDFGGVRELGIVVSLDAVDPRIRRRFMP